MGMILNPYQVAFVAPSTSYANTGGTGDRTAAITVTNTVVFDEGTSNNLVDGDFSENASGSISPDSGAASGLYVRFDFGSAKYINECKFYTNEAGTGTSSNGTFKWQGSDDASSWTDISANFSLIGGQSGRVAGDLSANGAYYRYYQLLGISGNTTGGLYWTEFEFKINA